MITTVITQVSRQSLGGRGREGFRAGRGIKGRFSGSESCEIRFCINHFDRELQPLKVFEPPRWTFSIISPFVGGGKLAKSGSAERRIPEKARRREREKCPRNSDGR